MEVEQPNSQYKILVVDDEENYRDVIRMALEFSGYQVFEAPNGVEGLAAAKKHTPDLIFCDINMPKMNGHELLKQLKEDPKLSGTPFIFLTGNSGMSDLRQGMQLGADDYLTKPFSAEELLAAVSTRLLKKRTLQKYYESQFDDIKNSIVRSLPHEFRTPLNGILGFSQILKEENNISPEEIKEIGTLIYRSGIRLQHLLENIVLFGQLQFLMNDQQKVQKLRNESESMLVDIIESIAAKQTGMHERPNAVLISVTDALVQISSVYLTKIIEEVIDNALKFSEAGSTVNISNSIGVHDVQIAIQDKGRGMTKEQIESVSAFHQFERGYYEQQGAGLGLVLAKLLTDLHGGSFLVESEEKKGTIIKIILPKSHIAPQV